MAEPPGSCSPTCLPEFDLDTTHQSQPTSAYDNTPRGPSTQPAPVFLPLPQPGITTDRSSTARQLHRNGSTTVQPRATLSVGKGRKTVQGCERRCVDLGCQLKFIVMTSRSQSCSVWPLRAIDIDIRVKLSLRLAPRHFSCLPTSWQPPEYFVDELPRVLAPSFFPSSFPPRQRLVTPSHLTTRTECPLSSIAASDPLSSSERTNTQHHPPPLVQNLYLLFDARSLFSQ